MEGKKGSQPVSFSVINKKKAALRIFWWKKVNHCPHKDVDENAPITGGQ